MATQCRVRSWHCKTFREQAAASTETDAELLDPFDYVQSGLRSE